VTEVDTLTILVNAVEITTVCEECLGTRANVGGVRSVPVDVVHNLASARRRSQFAHLGLIHFIPPFLNGSLSIVLDMVLHCLLEAYLCADDIIGGG